MLGGSSLRLAPLGFLLAGPAVIFLMISLFCRKSLSPGETRHFRQWETRRWARLTLGPTSSAATSQGTNTSFHPACVSLLSFSLYPHSRQYYPFFSGSHLSSGGGMGAQLYFLVVIVFFGLLNDYLAFPSVKGSDSADSLIRSM